MRPAFTRREPPLPPDAVVASGPAVPGLVAATTLRLIASVELRVCLGAEWMLVLGVTTDLPWAEGVAYLAWQEGLLVPTTLTVLPSADLLRRALAATSPPGHDLLAVVDDYVLTAPLPQRAATAAYLRHAVSL